MRLESASGVVSVSAVPQALCVFGLLATVTSIWGVGRDCLSVIILSLALWGVFGEATSSATNALFADSLSRGDRTKWFTWKGVTQIERHLDLPLCAGSASSRSVCLSVVFRSACLICTGSVYFDFDQECWQVLRGQWRLC